MYRVLVDMEVPRDNHYRRILEYCARCGIRQCGENIEVKKYLRKLQNAADDFELEDIWRVKNPTLKNYTFCQKNPLIKY